MGIVRDAILDEIVKAINNYDSGLSASLLSDGRLHVEYYERPFKGFYGGVNYSITFRQDA